MHLWSGLARRARRVRRARVAHEPIARDAKHIAGRGNRGHRRGRAHPKERGASPDHSFLAGCSWRMFDVKCLPIESAAISAACFSAETPE